MHIAIRFEAVLVYFLTFQQQYPLKEQLTQQLLTLPLGQRWGSSSANHGFVYNFELFKRPDFFSLDELLLALNSTHWCYEACKALHHYSDDVDIQQKIINIVLDATVAKIQQMLKVEADDYVNTATIIRPLAKFKILNSYDSPMLRSNSFVNRTAYVYYDIFQIKF